MTGSLTIADLASRQAIAQRLAEHGRGLDRADEALLAGCYHPDGFVDYGFYRGPAPDFAAMLGRPQPGQPITLHRTAQMWIDLDRDEARSESYVIALAQSPDEDGTMMQRVICGRYLDRHMRRDGIWRMTHRRYVMDVNANWPGATAPLPIQPLARHVPTGGHGAADTGQMLLTLGAARNRQQTRDQGEQGMNDPDAVAIDAVLSRQQIADLTMAYCRGVDRADEPLLRSIFHDDGVIVSGAFNGSGQLFATEICKIVKAVFNQTFHSIANQWIEVTGNGAVGETYVIAVSTMTNDDGSQSEMLTGGRYLDRFERRDGVWKIAERTFVSDWNRIDATTHSDAGLYASLDLRGKQGPDDPVYALWH